MGTHLRHYRNDPKARLWNDPPHRSSPVLGSNTTPATNKMPRSKQASLLQARLSCVWMAGHCPECRFRSWRWCDSLLQRQGRHGPARIWGRAFDAPLDGHAPPRLMWTSLLFQHDQFPRQSGLFSLVITKARTGYLLGANTEKIILHQHC